MRKYIAFFQAVASGPALVAITGAFAVLMVILALVDIPTGASGWSQEHYRARFEQVEAQAHSRVTQDAPQNIIDFIKNEYDILERALAQNDEASFLRIMGEYGALYIEALELGLVTGTENVEGTTAFLANQYFLISLSELDEPALYEFTSDIPGILAPLWFLGRLIPYVIPLVTSLFASWYAVSLFRRGSLLGSAPMARWKSFLMAWSGSWLCSIASLILACVPVTFLATARNGWGSLSYPSVFVQSGEVIVTDTMGIAGAYLAVYLAASSCICAVVCSISWLTRKPFSGIVAGVVIIALPLFPLWASDDPSSPLLNLPSTYLDIPRVAGETSLGWGADISAVMGATRSRGIVVLSVWTVSLVVVAGCVMAAAERKLVSRSMEETRGTVFLCNIRLAYGNTLVFDGASATFQCGQLHGLVAPNGYGKTTLLQSVAGNSLCRIGGTMAVDGMLCNPSYACRSATYYAQGSSIEQFTTHLSIQQHMHMAMLYWNSSRDPDAAAKLFDIERFTNKKAKSLSQGQRQLASLAMAWETDVFCLLLDEPMNALDPTNVSRVSSILKAEAESGKCIILSSHILSNMDELCDNVWYLTDGKIKKYEDGNATELYKCVYQ